MDMSAAIGSYNIDCSLVAVDTAGCWDTLDCHCSQSVPEIAVEFVVAAVAVVVVHSQLDTASVSAPRWNMVSPQVPSSSGFVEHNLVD